MVTATVCTLRTVSALPALPALPALRSPGVRPARRRAALPPSALSVPFAVSVRAAA